MPEVFIASPDQSVLEPGCQLVELDFFDLGEGDGLVDAEEVVVEDF